MFKKTCLALALLGAVASTHAETLVLENFDNVPGLVSKGWLKTNPTGPGVTPGWVQGLESNFTAHSGAGESYASSLWSDAAAGNSLSSWLITSAFSTENDVSVSFWARGGGDDSYIDQLTYGLVNSVGDIVSLLPVATVNVLGDWTLYSFTIAGQGAGTTGRFAFGHIGNPDTSNIVGVDDLRIDRIPEPSSWALAGVSLLGLMAARRRRRA